MFHDGTHLTDLFLYFGGPVNLQHCFVLHDESYLTNDTMKISEEVSLTSNTKIIEDIKNNLGPENYKINMGYAGWDKNQLEDEIKNGDWLIKPFSQNFIFNISDKDMWELSTIDLGLDPNDFMGKSGRA